MQSAPQRCQRLLLVVGHSGSRTHAHVLREPGLRWGVSVRARRMCDLPSHRS